MGTHSHIVVDALVAERHAAFRRQAAEDRKARLAHLYARLGRRRPALLADGSLVAEWTVCAACPDTGSAA
jgi:hypothetical protein